MAEIAFCYRARVGFFGWSLGKIVQNNSLGWNYIFLRKHFKEQINMLYYFQLNSDLEAYAILNALRNMNGGLRCWSCNSRRKWLAKKKMTFSIVVEWWQMHFIKNRDSIRHTNNCNFLSNNSFKGLFLNFSFIRGLYTFHTSPEKIQRLVGSVRSQTFRESRFLFRNFRKIVIANRLYDINIRICK